MEATTTDYTVFTDAQLEEERLALMGELDRHLGKEITEGSAW